MCEDNCQGSRLPDSLMAKTFHHIFHFIFHIAFLIKPFFVASPSGLWKPFYLPCGEKIIDIPIEKVVEVIANVYLTLASLTMFPKILLAWQSKKISTETLA